MQHSVILYHDAAAFSLPTNHEVFVRVSCNKGITRNVITQAARFACHVVVNYWSFLVFSGMPQKSE